MCFCPTHRSTEASHQMGHGGIDLWESTLARSSTKTYRLQIVKWTCVYANEFFFLRLRASWTKKWPSWANETPSEQRQEESSQGVKWTVRALHTPASVCTFLCQRKHGKPSLIAQQSLWIYCSLSLKSLPLTARRLTIATCLPWQPSPGRDPQQDCAPGPA